MTPRRRVPPRPAPPGAHLVCEHEPAHVERRVVELSLQRLARQHARGRVGGRRRNAEAREVLTERTRAASRHYDSERWR